MNKSVNEIAKDLGLVELSFNEIFVLSDSEKGYVLNMDYRGNTLNMQVKDAVLFLGDGCF